MYRIITILGALLTVGLIVAGSVARLYDNTWAIGNLTPITIHIYTAYALAAIPLLLFLLSWWRTKFKTAAVTASTLLILTTGLEIVLGFRLQQQPDFEILTAAHLMLAAVVLMLFFWLSLRSQAGIRIFSQKSGPIWFSRFGILLVLVEILLGSWVTLSQSSMACFGFPTCNAQWWPDADYAGAAATLFKTFISGGAASYSFEAQVAINWLHRIGALVCFIFLNILMLKATASGYSKPVRNAGLWLSFLLFVEIGLGLVGYKFNMPLWLIIAHTVFAALLLLPLIAIGFYSRYGFEQILPVEVEPAVPPPIAIPEIEPAEVIRPQQITEEAYAEPPAESLYLRLKSQLGKTRAGIGGLLASLPLAQKGITEELLEDIEASLLVADVGIDVTTKIINRLRQRLDRHQLADSAALTAALKEELQNILAPCSKPLIINAQHKPFVILVVGVNGVGKTTTIGKLARRLSAQGHSVMLAAGDTFRAAAVEQLQVWGQRNSIPVIAQQTGADSASVIFDAIQSAQSKGVDVLIADTAGRLHTKANLMEELKKVKRIMGKLDETAPHEVLLVLDAGTGQNALSQTKQFNEAIDLTGLVLTKLDGTAKGGVIFALAKQAGLPIRFIGVGESIEDLQDFNAETFIDALFVKD